MSKRAPVIAIYNQKGGVGKTALAWALSAIASADGCSVLSVDLDSQLNLTYSLLGLPGLHRDISDNLLGALLRCGVAGCIDRTERSGDIIPGSARIDALSLYTHGDGQDLLLCNLLSTSPLQSYDLILLDCPPGIGLVNVNALTAADYLLTPLQLDIYSLQGIDALSQTVQSVKDNTNAGLSWLGLAITDYRPALVVSRHLEAELQTVCGACLVLPPEPILQRIRYCAKAKEAILCREAITAKNGGVSYKDYSALWQTIKEKVLHD